MALSTSPIMFFKDSPIVAKGSSVLYEAKLIDEKGSPVGTLSIDALTLTIIDFKSNTVINDVDETDILNVGRGTLDSLGNLSILLGSEDTLFDGNVSVKRSMVIKWTYGDEKTGSHRVDFNIVSLGI